MRRTLHGMAIVAVATGLLVACADSRPADAPATQPPAQPPAAAQPESNTLQEILERGTLRVGTTGDFYMSAYNSDTGERSGFDIDLTRKLAADMGVEIEYVRTDWSSFVSGLAAGRYDLTTGASYTVGRARLAAYSIPIATTGTVALIRSSDREAFAAWDDINRPGVGVAVQHGGMVEEYAEELVPNARIEVIDSPASAFAEVEAGRADVVLANAIDAAARLAGGSSLEAASVQPRHANFIGLLMRQGDAELRTFVDAWIRAQEASGYLAELTSRYHLNF